MADFNVRSDSVNVEQLMEQIRGRIREKRGVDYTEQEIRELAAVKLEKFLDPRAVRSDLLERFRTAHPPDVPIQALSEDMLFETHRPSLRIVRRLFRPVLKLFFNPTRMVQAINAVAAQNQATHLSYEVLHNLVIELTRLGIEVRNLKMRVESLGGRLELNERRERALEGVVMYKPTAEERVEAPAARHTNAPPPRSAPPARSTPPARSNPPVPSSPVSVSTALPSPLTETGEEARPGEAGGQSDGAEGPGQRSRRRRRRRGRRSPGAPRPTGASADGAPVSAEPQGESTGTDRPDHVGTDRPDGPDSDSGHDGDA